MKTTIKYLWIIMVLVSLISNSSTKDAFIKMEHVVNKVSNNGVDNKTTIHFNELNQKKLSKSNYKSIVSDSLEIAKDKVDIDINVVEKLMYNQTYYKNRYL